MAKDTLIELLDSLLESDALDDLVAKVTKESDPERKSALMAALAIKLARRPDDRLELEAKQSSFKDFDLKPLMQKAEIYQSRLCMVTTPTSSGTGFLIGPDTVLTNYHVVQDLIGDALGVAGARNTNVVFDYAVSHKQGQSTSRYALHPVWLLAKAKNGENENDPKPDELDFAVLKLAGTPGMDTIETTTGIKDKRGWFPLEEAVDAPAAGTVAFLFHHPAAGPAKFSFHEFVKAPPSGARIRYRANSSAGSSGGLVVDQDFRLVGLHNSGGQEFNQGVPLTRIRQFLFDSGSLTENGTVIQPRSQPRCLLFFPAQNATTRAIRAQIVVPAIEELDFAIEDLSQGDLEAFNVGFSPLRSADVTVICLTGNKPFAMAAIGFRSAHGKPTLVIEIDPPAPGGAGEIVVRNASRAQGIDWEALGPNPLKAVMRNRELVSGWIQQTFRKDSWGPLTVNPWTVLEFSEDCETYLDATDAGAEAILGPGMKARDLIGRNGREVVASLEQRVLPNQWNEFNAEQSRLYERILKSSGQLSDDDIRALRTTCVPLVFENREGPPKAFLPILSRYGYSNNLSKHRLEVAYVDVSHAINLAFGGHWEIRPTLGPNAIHMFDRLEQLRIFLPVGIISIGRDGTISDTNRAAELLLNKARIDLVGQSVADVCQEIGVQFKDAGDAPGIGWYEWDRDEQSQLPPLKIHTFSVRDRILRGCTLGVRTATNNESDGCTWVFALVEAKGQDSFVADLQSYGEKEWLWQSYAASYDKVLLNCNYYRETRDRHIEEIRKIALARQANTRLLDVGAGTGNVSVAILREFPNCRVTAIDSSRAMLQAFHRKLRPDETERLASYEISAELLDTLDLEKAHVVSLMMALFDMEKPEQALSGLRDKMANGGTLIVTEPKERIDVEKIVEGAREQLRKDGLLQRIERDWNVVRESGRKLVAKAKVRQEWTGIDGVIRWLSRNGFECQEPRDCYFGQCQTVVARKM